MSKYTTEVRFICESVTGNTESKGFNSVDTILTAAAPIIFDFDFPIFDPDYKLPLEKKILRHYYTREISEETYGLWKLRLEDRLNMIMPYYNQLYNSALLVFDPFKDVDLTTEHAGNENGVVNGEAEERLNRENTRNNESNEIGDETNIRTGDNTASKTGENTNNIVENNTDNTIKTGDNVTGKDFSETNGNSHTGTITDENDKTSNVVSSEGEYGNNNETKTGNKTNTYEGDITNNESSSRNTKANGTNSNTQWDLFSDTPQGGIDGLSTPNSSAPSGLENNVYLTTARKVTDNGSTTNNNTEIGDTVNIGNEASETKENSTDTIEGSKNNVREGVEVGNANENNKRTFDESNEGSKGGSENNVNSFVETNVGSNEKTREETQGFNENNNDNVNEVNIKNNGRNVIENGNENENVINNRLDSRVSTTTEEYLQKVSGKSGGMTYSAMLIEYRETFINIDEMVIEELSDLFFGLW